MQIAWVLMPLAFAYDVWWVFLQPVVTGGPSVMVAVATGRRGCGYGGWVDVPVRGPVSVCLCKGSAVFDIHVDMPLALYVHSLSTPHHSVVALMLSISCLGHTGGESHEHLPMLLEWPQRGLGSNPAISMLGLGDVVLPGLLVALTRRHDLHAGLHAIKGYFLPCLAGYSLGLLATYAALLFSLFGDQGQPALLYLVPFTLGPVTALAAARGDLARLWGGSADGDKDARQGGGVGSGGVSGSGSGNDAIGGIWGGGGEGDEESGLVGVDEGEGASETAGLLRRQG